MKNIILFIWIVVSSMNGLSGQIIHDSHERIDLLIDEWMNGSFNHSDIEGKHIVLDFWAVWCRACIEHIPYINDLANLYEDEIAFISVNSYDSREYVTDFITKRSFESHVYLDKDERLKELFDVHCIPSIYIVDRNGFLRWEGYPTDLTASFLETFVKNDSIIDRSAISGVIDTAYQVFDRHTNQPIGKLNVVLRKHIYANTDSGITSVHTEYKDAFRLYLQNFDINEIIKRVYSLSYDIEPQWVFEGKKPLGYNLDLMVEFEGSSINKYDLLEYLKAVLEDQIRYTVRDSNMVHEIWYLNILDSVKLENFVSENQDSEQQKQSEIGKYIDYQSAYLYTIAWTVGLLTGKTVENEHETYLKYDLKINWEENIYEINTLLSSKYGIEFVKSTKPIETLIIRYE